MDGMKYIRYKHGTGALTQMVIFTPIDSHADMARKLGLKDKDIVSAGFFHCDPESVKCQGESVSLGVESQEADAGYVTRVVRGY